ncbi:60S ribosomal subunit assembly/export protein [Aspergillus nanangensis]|uniref:60S ribosomal subunit assembly/export protein n=1 Tax=Aspergillus nanangensis TaxID=2582783 RepID=A0AAD4CD81_ASPNN|nr:60S ribosomal subunit assembly/export protein [Aspergillus nanangensis]
MAPTKGSAKPKPDSHKGKTISSGTKISKKGVKRPPPKEVKSKARTEPSQQKKTKKRAYTEAELDLPKLNAITPVGVVNPKGRKKGKVFVDDKEGMATILAMVNAEKEGQIESKMMRARQLEEIREAKLKEAEARQAQKKSKLEEAKDSIRNKKKGNTGDDTKAKGNSTKTQSQAKGKRKSVSFA